MTKHQIPNNNQLPNPKFQNMRFASFIIGILKLFGIGCLVIGISPTAWGVTPAELAQLAEAAYIRGDYAKALQNWQTLTEIGFVNGAIYNNMGNAYWREGKVGPARLYFLKAQALSPRDDEIRANLEFIQNPTPTEEAAPTPQRLLERIPLHKFKLNVHEALWVGALCALAFFGAMALGRWRGNKLMRWVALVFVLPWLWGGFQLGRNLYVTSVERPGVLLTPEADLLAHPVLGGNSIQRLQEGARLKLIKKQGDFYQVKTLEGQKGWLPRQSVGEVG